VRSLTDDRPVVLKELMRTILFANSMYAETVFLRTFLSKLLLFCERS
jgi:hypothetical protein